MDDADHPDDHEPDEDAMMPLARGEEGQASSGRRVPPDWGLGLGEPVLDLQVTLQDNTWKFLKKNIVITYVVQKSLNLPSRSVSAV